SMILEARLVAAKALLDLVGGLVEAKVRFVSAALGVQAHSRAEAQRAVGAIAGALAGHDDMATDRAAEVAGDRSLDLSQDMLTQSFPDVEVLTGYPQGHRTLALPLKARWATIVRRSSLAATHAFPPPSFAPPRSVPAASRSPVGL